MSPASYLTAPPRGVGSSIAQGSSAHSRQIGHEEAGPEHRGAGKRVEDEVVPGDDDRQHDGDRVEHAEDPDPALPPISPEPHPRADRSSTSSRRRPTGGPKRKSAPGENKPSPTAQPACRLGTPDRVEHDQDLPQAARCLTASNARRMVKIP